MMMCLSLILSSWPRVRPPQCPWPGPAQWRPVEVLGPPRSVGHCTMENQADIHLEDKISSFVETLGLFIQVDYWKHVYHLFIPMNGLLSHQEY